jgi:fructokinase
MASESDLFGCIEAGGTKFVLGLVRRDRTIVDHVRLPTRGPDETIGEAIAWLERACGDHGAIDALGIASFGPVGLDRGRPDWGRIFTTTKPGWSDADMAGPFARAFGCPVGFDTDVNGAALAESLWGVSVGADVSVYVTVGTGIGGGTIVDGVPLHGLGHPEMGHAFPPRHPDDRDFVGICPFHGDCFEGLASGPAIAARWGVSLSELPAGHSGHAIVAFYLAQLTITLSALIAPRRIVMGGGVMATPGLIERIRLARAAIGGGYFMDDGETVVVPPALGADAGLLGALALAVGATL